MGPTNTTAKRMRKQLRRALKGMMRSYKFKLPLYDLPLRVRPWFVLFTAIVMIILAFLGFTNFARALPLNDKILHLVCLCLATAVFYFIFDVEEDARRVWFWRHAPLILTGLFCFFFGGIVSEIVQSLLPYKEFQMSDVAANLIGASIGLWTAYYLERYYRHRREIARLYRPIALDPEDLLSSSEDEDDTQSTMLLPTHHTRSAGANAAKSTSNKEGRIRLGDVWDEREELFGIGGSDDEDDFPDHPRGLRGTPSPVQVVGPKIVVTTT